VRRAALTMALLLAVVLIVPSRATAQTINPDALWKIVHGLCVPDEEQHHDPAPCAEVDLAGGYAVLKDILGKTQHLVIPTAETSGIETPAIIAPDAPNYFADAWRARRFVDQALGHELPRDMIALAINSRFARSQEQLHIHVDCIRPDVRAALRDHQGEIGVQWAPFDPPLAGRHYRAMRVTGNELTSNPFVLLADGVAGARGAMGQHTLVVTGASFSGGAPGFILLDDQADLAAGDRAHGESLQDHSCAVAQAAPPT
jgi:CDP-diacylglycerol pyrophosphatase